MRLLFLHGMGGSAADWDEVRALTDGTALSLPAGADLQETVSAIVDQIPNPAETILCGYSMGGRLAILAAHELLNQGERLAGLALLGAGMGFPDEKSRQERQDIDERWAVMAERDPPMFWSEWYRQGLFATFQELPEARQKTWLNSRLSMEISTLSAQFRNFGPARHGFLEPALLRLKNAPISVLYLAGELDKKYLNLGQKLAKEVGVALAVIPQAGHILPLEAPRAVAERLKQFSSAQ